MKRIFLLIALVIALAPIYAAAQDNGLVTFVVKKEAITSAGRTDTITVDPGNATLTLGKGEYIDLVTVVSGTFTTDTVVVTSHVDGWYTTDGSNGAWKTGASSAITCRAGTFGSGTLVLRAPGGTNVMPGATKIRVVLAVAAYTDHDSVTRKLSVYLFKR